MCRSSPPADRRDVDVRSQRAILLGERHPLAVGRHGHRLNASDRVRRHDRRLAVGDAVAVELLVRRRVEQRLRVGRPDERALLVVEVGDLLQVLALGVGEPDLVAPGAVRDERDVLAVGRPLRILAPGRHVVRRDARDVAAVGRDREQLPARGDHGAAARRRDVERVDLVRHRLRLDLVLLVVGRDLDLDLRRLARRDVELPDPEVLFVDDHLAVARHRREEQAPVGVARHLHRLPAAGRHLVDVVDALAHREAARHRVLLVRQRIADEVDLIVGAPHRPVAVVLLVGQQLRVGLVREIRDPQVRRVAAAIVLARPHGWMAVEDDLLAVRRERAPVAPVDGQRRLGPAAHRNRVERRDVRERAVAVRRAESRPSTNPASSRRLRRCPCSTSAAWARRRSRAPRTRRSCRSDSTRTRSSVRQARSADTFRARGCRSDAGRPCRLRWPSRCRRDS